jgi:hypothetical protein
MADTRDEYGLRHRAIELHRQGIARGVIRERLGRARSWVGRYITATIFTHRRMLGVKVGARRYKRFPFPIPEPLVPSIVPLPRGWF